jgi:putative PIN family toxin of toxin-antitoxin system
MKVLLDTNVLAAAAATRGLCADVLRAVLAEHELVLCPQIIGELRRVLRDKFGMATALIDDYLGMLQQDAVCTHNANPPNIKLRDKDDLGILAAAKNGEAKVVVTGDKELQRLASCAGVRIVSPRQFWEEMIAR